MLRKILISAAFLSSTSIGTVAIAADAKVAPVFIPKPPAAAPAPYDIAFGVYGGQGIINAGDDPYRIFGVEGSFVAAMAGFGLQIDGRGENGLETDSDTYGGTQAGIHLYMGSSGLSFGLAGALAADQDDDDWNIHGLFAGEAVLRAGMFNIGGQVGWIGTTQTEGNDRLGDAWFARGLAQIFFSPNLKLQGEVAYFKGRFDSDLDSFHMLTAGAELEFKFHPNVSAFVAWDGQWTTDDTWGGTAATNQVVGGLRFTLGGSNTLQQAASRGAPMGTLNISRLNAIAAENN